MCDDGVGRCCVKSAVSIQAIKYEFIVGFSNGEEESDWEKRSVKMDTTYINYQIIFLTKNKD